MIHLDAGLLTSPLLLDLCRTLANRWVIIADTHTEKLFGSNLQHFLTENGIKADLIAFAAGEAHKSRETKEAIEDRMLALGCGRDTGLLALGGGIVTDLGGFVASTYCRGIPLIHLPTTLLAMVDASIGGKTGVNTPAGKNMIGTHYLPHAILMDLDVLKDLPLQELQNGIVECIKHGAILDPSYFQFLETHASDVLKRDLPTLRRVIQDSSRIKQEVVTKDERETSLRRLLNFGHTFGHALETLTRHAIPHGQAVAIGMLGEAHLSLLLRILPQSAFNRLNAILRAYHVKLHLENPPSTEEFLSTMKLDKKALKATPRFVILQEIGKCLECGGQYCQSVDPAALTATLKWLAQDLSASLQPGIVEDFG